MCPECGGQLVILEFDGIEIDHCPACGGTWLDAGDLEEIDFQAGVKAGCLTRLLSGGKAAKGQGRPGHRHCPRCNQHMIVDRVGEKEPVEIDRCPRGCGCWYDLGELKQLVACHKEEEEEGAVAKFFMEMLHHTLS